MAISGHRISTYINFCAQHISALPIGCWRAFLYFNTNPVHIVCHFTFCAQTQNFATDFDLWTWMFIDIAVATQLQPLSSSPSHAHYSSELSMLGQSRRQSTRFPFPYFARAVFYLFSFRYDSRPERYFALRILLLLSSLLYTRIVSTQTHTREIGRADEKNERW